MTTRRRKSPEQFVRLLGQADPLLANGEVIASVCRTLGISESSNHRWRAHYGGMYVTDANQLKKLYARNAMLKRLLADAEVVIAALKEIAKGKWKACEPSALPRINSSLSSDCPSARRARSSNCSGRRSAIPSQDVVDILERLSLTHGMPKVLWMDSGPGLTYRALAQWADGVVDLALIPPGEPWKSGYGESFHSRQCYELLNITTFSSLLHARFDLTDWHHEYNHVRRHSSLGYQASIDYAGTCA